MSVSVAICIMHAEFDPERRETLQKLLDGIDATHACVKLVHVERDNVRKGAWPVARACWLKGAESGATHVVLMNDDAEPCPRFTQALVKTLEANPKAIISYYVNDTRAEWPLEKGEHWYTTYDGLVGVTCGMPASLAADFIRFCDEALVPAPYLTDDGRINLYAMATSRLIWHPVPGLVDHQLPDSSMVGNADHDYRRAAIPLDPNAADIDWSLPSRVANLQFRREGLYEWLRTAVSPAAAYRLKTGAKYRALKAEYDAIASRRGV